MFGVQGLIELGKSIAKVILLGGVGLWLLLGQIARDHRPDRAGHHARRSSEVGHSFVIAVLVMAAALAADRGDRRPAQIYQRLQRLKMTKQEAKDEHKQTEGSPELKAAIRRRQHEVARNSARGAIAEATVVLTNPTHFAVALRYRPGVDAAPAVVAARPRRHRRGDPRARRRA